MVLQRWECTKEDEGLVVNGLSIYELEELMEILPENFRLSFDDKEFGEATQPPGEE